MEKKKKAGLYPPPCTFPSSVHCPVHLHSGPAPSVYTAFLLFSIVFQLKQFMYVNFNFTQQRISMPLYFSALCTTVIHSENSTSISKKIIAETKSQTSYYNIKIQQYCSISQCSTSKLSTHYLMWLFKDALIMPCKVGFVEALPSTAN